MGIRHFCDKCPKSFTKKSDLRDHLRFKHGNAGLKCAHCDYRCLYNADMQMHMEVKHLDRVDSQKKFLCDQCDFATNSVSLLSKHCKLKHADLSGDTDCANDYNIKYKYQCDYCKYRINFLPHLTKHIENMHGTKEFSCDLCDFTTRKPVEFKRHWKYRHDPNSKRIPCDKCHFSTTRADALKRHIEVVHEGKRVACSHVDCNYIARRKGDLVKHIQTVHEKIRHKCEMCEFSCSDKFYLRRHVTAKHDTKHDPD